MQCVRLILCLTFVISNQAVPENERPKRDIRFLKSLLKNTIFGSENKTDVRPQFLIKDAAGNYKMVNIPDGYKAIYIKPVPEGLVQHEVPKSEIGVLETYLGTKSTKESLVALEDVKKLIETGIISKKDGTEGLIQVPSVLYEGNQDKDVHGKLIHTPYSPVSLNERNNVDSSGHHAPNGPIVGEHSEASFNKIYRPNEPLTVNEHEEFYSNELHVPHISASNEFSDPLIVTQPDGPFAIPFTAGPPRTSYDLPLNDAIAVSLDPKTVYHSYKPVLTIRPNRGYSYKQIYNDGSGIYYYVNGKKEVIPRLVKNVQGLSRPKFVHKTPDVPIVTPEQEQYLCRLFEHNNTMRKEVIEEPSGIKVSEHTAPAVNNLEEVPVKLSLPTSFVVPKPSLPHYEIVHNPPFSHRYSYVQTNSPTNPQVTIDSHKLQVHTKPNEQFKPKFYSKLPSEKYEIQSIEQNFKQSLPVIRNNEFTNNKLSYPPIFIAPISSAPFSHRYSYVQTNFPNPPATINVSDLSNAHVQFKPELFNEQTREQSGIQQSLPLEHNKEFNKHELYQPTFTATINSAPFSHRYSYVQTNFPNPPVTINVPQALNNPQGNSLVPEFIQTTTQRNSHAIDSFKLNEQIKSETQSYRHQFKQSSSIDNEVEFSKPKVPITYPYPPSSVAPKPSSYNYEIVHAVPFSHTHSNVQKVPTITEESSSQNAHVEPTKPFSEFNKQTLPQSNPDFVSSEIKNNQNLKANQYSYTQTHSNGNDVVYKNQQVIISGPNSQSLPTINKPFLSVQFSNEITNQSKTESSSETSSYISIETTTANSETIETSTDNILPVKDNQPKRRKVYRRVKVRRNGTKVYGDKVEVTEAPLSVKPIVVPEGQKQFSYKQINNDGSSKTISFNNEQKSVVVDVSNSADNERGDVPF